MACEESDHLRRTCMNLMLNRKSDKIHQKLHNQIEIAIKEWERIIYDYINVTKELNKLRKTAEHHKKLANLRMQIKQYTDLMKLSTENFDALWKMIEIMLPVASVSSEWIDNVIKQEQKLNQMKEALVPLLLYSCNREVIEAVQKMLLHINEIVSKITFLRERLRQGMEDTIKYGSNVITNRNAINNSDADGSETSSLDDDDEN